MKSKIMQLLVCAIISMAAFSLYDALHPQYSRGPGTWFEYYVHPVSYNYMACYVKPLVPIKYSIRDMHFEACAAWGQGDTRNRQSNNSSMILLHDGQGKFIKSADFEIHGIIYVDTLTGELYVTSNMCGPHRPFFTRTNWPNQPAR